MTTILVAGFAVYVINFSVLEGLLLGSIVSCTDAAAVFAVLRSGHVGLHARLKHLLELESGSNDPMAVFLTLGFVSLLTNQTASLLDLLLMFALQMPMGLLLG